MNPSKHPTITLEPITEYDGELTGYLASCEQDGCAMTIGETRRRLPMGQGKDWEPEHELLARALREAADWCAAMPIDIGTRNGTISRMT